MLCDTCVTYAVSDTYSAHQKGAWIEDVVTGWRNAKSKLKKHASCMVHTTAVSRMKAHQQTSREGSVVTVAAKGMAAVDLTQAKENRENIKKLLRTVYYLCRRKNAVFADAFNDALELQIENGDSDLESWLEKAPKNANYTSNMVVQEYILALSKWLEDPLLASLKGSSMFTLMADESTDIATVEEISICARWVTQDGNVEEHYLGLVDLKSCDAETISNTLITFMEKKGIDAKKMRGQGYDGASTMSGKNNGVQMRIRVICSLKAIYVHCRAHLLQLALVESSKKIKTINSVFATMMAIWKTFHYSPKKAARLADIQAVLENPKMKMIKPSDTRWTAYERCVTAVQKSMKALVDTFYHLYAETSKYKSCTSRRS